MRTSQPGPPGHAHAAPWVRWLLPAAVAAGFVALLALPGGAAPGMPLSYTRFLADVSAGSGAAPRGRASSATYPAPTAAGNSHRTHGAA